MLQRFLFGADMRFGQRVRVFGEVQSGLIGGQLRSPRPTDRNPIDLHQGFVELRQPVRQKTGSRWLSDARRWRSAARG